MEILKQFYSNEKAKQTLVNFITDGRLPHALLLEGEAGCGKTHFARLAACAMLCQSEQKPCGQCRNCRLILQDTHPDVLVVSPDAPEKPYAVSALRDLIVSCYVLPNDGDKKIYILRNIHEMSEQAQNTLLKIIEEPPAHVLFILTCQSRARILPTILSRVVTLTLSPCSEELCAKALQERNPETDEETCLRMAKQCGGNIGRALTIMQDERLSSIHSDAQEAAQLICGSSEFDLLCLLNRYNRKKADFLLLLEELRQIFVQVVRQKHGAADKKFLPDKLLHRISALQTMRILDIIDTVSGEALQNVAVSLAAAHLCSAVQQQLHS